MGNSIRDVRTMMAIVTIAMVVTASFLMPIQKAEAAGPSHTNIQTALNLASGYIDSLYKDLSPGEVGSGSHAVLAEYPAMPIRIEASDRTIRAGEDVDISFLTKTNLVRDLTEVSSDTITYYIEFRALSGGTLYPNSPLLKVTVDFDYGSTHKIRVEVKNEAWDSSSPRSSAHVYLGSDYLGQASKSGVGQTWVWTSTSVLSNDSDLRSFRYIERHATQLGREWYLANSNPTRSSELHSRLTSEGYTPSYDIYSPMFGSGTSLGYNFMYDDSSTGVYRDCFTEPSIRSMSYQYHSKVCNGVSAYVAYSGSSDWLVPTLWAIHLLNKGVNPNTPVYDGFQTWSPRQVAFYVMGKWIPDIGIKSPYSDTHASAVRTAAFLVLMTKLGYGHGLSPEVTYADKAASALLNPQVKANGIVTRENENGSTSSFLRPIHKGGFYTAWNGFNYVAKKSILQNLADSFNQPDETIDIKPSNAESTITIAQSLRVYDCYVYGSNCTNVP